MSTSVGSCSSALDLGRFCCLHDSHCAEHASYSSAPGNPSTSGSFEIIDSMKMSADIRLHNLMLIARSVGSFPQDHKMRKLLLFMAALCPFGLAPFFHSQERSLLPLPLPFGLLLMRGRHLETLRIVPNKTNPKKSVLPHFCWYL